MGKYITEEETAALRYMVAKGEITEDQAAEIIVQGTPHLWIEANLEDPENPGKPVKLRSYQVDILKPGRSKALVWGRQCIEINEYIYTPTGPVKAGSIKDGDTIFGGIVEGYHIFEDEGVEVAFSNGTKIKVNLEHPFMTKNGWKHAGQLTEEDFVEFCSYEKLCQIQGKLSGKSPLDRETIKKDTYFLLGSSVITRKEGKAICFGFSTEEAAYNLQWLLWTFGIETYVAEYEDLWNVCTTELEKLHQLTKGIQHKEQLDINSVRFVKVSQIKQTGKITVAGWTTVGNSEIISYLGMRTHNTGKTFVMSASMIWEGFTEPNVSIAFFAPTRKHINDIFDYVEKMIKANPELTSMIIQNKKGPRNLFKFKAEDAVSKIELKNGSVYKFFHTQTKRAREQIRGTKASKLYLDEAAFITPDAFIALSGLLTSANDLFIWAQSTPLAKEGWFYEFVQQAEVKSHVTSMQSPTWTPYKEKVARLMAPDEISFQREYLGVFAGNEWSAFPDHIIDRSQELCALENGELKYQQKNYMSSEQIRAMPGETYVGLDWNVASNGTKIVVFKKIPASEKIIYQDVYSIEHPTYTQTKAVDKLFELINDLKPSGIGIDKGYAAGSLEIISRKLEYPENQWIKDRIEVVNFGEVLHIPTLEFFGSGLLQNEHVEELLYSADNREDKDGTIKLPLKVFMVSIMTRMLSTDQLAVGPIDYEKERKTLLSELRSVKIDRISSNGYPVYSKVDLHKFSAALLAVYVHFLKSGKYKIVNEKNRKTIRKEISFHHETATPVVDIWEPSRAEIQKGLFFTPKTLTKRDIEEKAPIKTSLGRISPEEAKSLGMTVLNFSSRPSGAGPRRPQPSWSWRASYNSKRGRRSIG